MSAVRRQLADVGVKVVVRDGGRWFVPAKSIPSPTRLGGKSLLVQCLVVVWVDFVDVQGVV